jgi:hypothetical protein
VGFEQEDEDSVVGLGKHKVYTDARWQEEPLLLGTLTTLYGITIVVMQKGYGNSMDSSLANRYLWMAYHNPKTPCHWQVLSMVGRVLQWNDLSTTRSTLNNQTSSIFLRSPSLYKIRIPYCITVFE